VAYLNELAYTSGCPLCPQADDDIKDKAGPATASYEVEMLCYKDILPVLESWEKVKQLPDYGQVFGGLVFKKLFELEPQLKNLFSFGRYEGEALFESAMFKMHSTNVAETFDYIASSLLDLDRDYLVELGQRHTQFRGVKPEYFHPLGQAVLYALETVLGDDWNAELKKGWTVVFEFLASAMTEGMEEPRST